MCLSAETNSIHKMAPGLEQRTLPRPLDIDSITKPWQSELLSRREEIRRDRPNYYINDPSSLITSSFANTFITGTGDDVFSTILPHIACAESEIIFATCYWARSTSLAKLSHTLRLLSSKALQQGGSKIRVRIGFSSLSVFQKLFHTPSISGKIYPPDTWTKKLGLPSPSELQGLDLEIKSIFLLPFSVMHPKFIIIDRKKVFLPSCNVSWEAWFEGCVELSGPIVQKFVQFWEEFWSNDKRSLPDTLTAISTPASEPPQLFSSNTPRPAYSVTPLTPTTSIPTVFLPSPHHLNPRFRPFTSTSQTHAPPTPLNTFLLHLLSHAHHSIYIQTPNLTSPPVLTALLRALRRSVSVHILTSSRLMILEQLVTAGTTTARCMRKLAKRHKTLACLSPLPTSRSSATPLRPDAYDEEAALGTPTPAPGALTIEFFEPRGGARGPGGERGEPLQSHLKLTVVDELVAVLGSGNMDRASWFTSQELGVAFFDREMTVKVREAVGREMEGRVRVFYKA